MQIICYRNTAENNRVNKGQYLQQLKVIDGTLRTPTSFLNPVIDIEIDSNGFKAVQVKINNIPWQVQLYREDQTPDFQAVGFVTSTSYDIGNYWYIPDLSRYYFITDIVAMTDKIFRVSLHVDVLMSYQSNIQDVVAYVSRNEFTYDSELIDNELALQNDVEVTYEEFYSDLFFQPNNNYNYVVTIVSEKMYSGWLN